MTETIDREPAAPHARAGPIDVTEHLAWARSIARGVREDFRFARRSQEEEDLEATAYLALVRTARLFDPAEFVPAGGDAAGAFRGYASHFVRGECKREARRLRNGGTYHTRREGTSDPVVLESIEDRRTPDGDPIDLEDDVLPPELLDPVPAPDTVLVVPCAACGRVAAHRVSHRGEAAPECADCEDGRRARGRQLALMRRQSTATPD